MLGSDVRLWQTVGILRQIWMICTGSMGRGLLFKVAIRCLAVPSVRSRGDALGDVLADALLARVRRGIRLLNR